MKTCLELSEGWEITRLPAGSAEAVRRLSESGELAVRPEMGWFGSTMPAEVHEILLAHDIIDDPAMLGNARKCLWVAESDWVYKCAFPAETQGRTAYLHFKGLDTLVDVYLNGVHLAYHNDMYLPLRVDVTEHLREDNVLALHFHSPHGYIANYDFPAEWEGKVAPQKVIRKPYNDFTDYLGPKPYLTPIGVYDKVVLEVIDEVELLDVDISYDLDPDFGAAMVKVGVRGAGGHSDGFLRSVVTDPEGQVVSEIEVPIPDTGSAWNHSGELAVAAPRLWWPRGYGDHPLYAVTVEVSTGGRLRDSCVKSIGFRRVEMVSPFEFVINDRPVKLWGAQPAPINGITHRWDNEKSNRILDLAENCNMNAQRIWGSCDRYDDEYYNETDRRGILVWQEFFHDYGMYPDTEDYRDLCRKEAEYQVKRLKHHPSLLMWCGGNEAVMGAEFDHPGADCIGGAIFTEDYRGVCAELDPERFYHINSPYGGAFANDPLAGDTHSYTNTWYVPGADFPVMIAEEIRVSPPSVKSMVKYFSGEDPWPASYSGKLTSADEYPWPLVWNERTSTQGWKKIPAVELFYDPTDLRSMVHRFGAAHGLYMRQILENNRRGKPATDAGGKRVCMGHFVCRWNDSWPIIYGSMLDYYTEPYIPYYAIKRAYEPVLLSFEVADFINVWVVNDSAEDISGTLVVKLFDPRANEFVNSLSMPVSVAAGESALVTDLNAFKQFSREYVLYGTIVDEEGGVRARSNDFVDIERHLKFPDARLDLSVSGDTLRITTDRFARCVELSGDEDGDEFGWVFEDNYFDLLPGEEKRVRILGRHRRGTVSAKPFYAGSRSSVDLPGTP
jgi:beta-mannosidase